MSQSKPTNPPSCSDPHFECHYPDFNKIIDLCRDKILERFPQYGNSWQGCYDFKFWRTRLETEIKEIWRSERPEETKREIIDAINVLVMMYYNVDLEYHNREPSR